MGTCSKVFNGKDRFIEVQKETYKDCRVKVDRVNFFDKGVFVRELCRLGVGDVMGFFYLSHCRTILMVARNHEYEKIDGSRPSLFTR